MYFVFISILLCTTNAQQVDFQPFLSLLRPENMRSMAELATEISSMAAKNMANNERDVQKTVNAPTMEKFDPNAKPSQMLGGAFSNIAYQSRGAFLNALDKFEASTPMAITMAPIQTPQTLPTIPPMTLIPNTSPPPPTLPPAMSNIFGMPSQVSRSTEMDNIGSRDVLGVRGFKSPEKVREIRYAEPNVAPIIDAAPVESPSVPAAAPSISSAESAAPAGSDNIALSRPPAPRNMFNGNPFMQIAQRFLQVGTGNGKSGSNEPLPQIGIRDFMGNSDSNFGLPKGKGCLPFISEFMQIAYGNCQNTADEKAFDAWGEELRRAIMTGEIDLFKASQETCRRGAERQQCDALREAVANCDVLASIEIGSQLQRAMKRCEEVTGMMDQSPAAVLGQLNSLISGEMAQGFLNNFLKTG